MPHIPRGADDVQVALLGLLIPGSYCAYYDIGGEDLKKAIMLIRHYCEMPEYGRSWRKQVQFSPPTGAAGGMPGGVPGGMPGSPFGGFGLGSFSYAGSPPFGGLGAYSLPNEATLRQAVITLLTAVFLSQEGPFTITKPLPLRRQFADMMGGNLAGFVKFLRIVEKDFNLPSAPYDARPN